MELVTFWLVLQVVLPLHRLHHSYIMCHCLVVATVVVPVVAVVVAVMTVAMTTFEPPRYCEERVKKALLKPYRMDCQKQTLRT